MLWLKYLHFFFLPTTYKPCRSYRRDNKGSYLKAIKHFLGAHDRGETIILP